MEVSIQAREGLKRRHERADAGAPSPHNPMAEGLMAIGAPAGIRRNWRTRSGLLRRGHDLWEVDEVTYRVVEHLVGAHSREWLDVELAPEGISTQAMDSAIAFAQQIGLVQVINPMSGLDQLMNYRLVMQGESQGGSDNSFKLVNPKGIEFDVPASWWEVWGTGQARTISEIAGRPLTGQGGLPRPIVVLMIALELASRGLAVLDLLDSPKPQRVEADDHFAAPISIFSKDLVLLKGEPVVVPTFTSLGRSIADTGERQLTWRAGGRPKFVSEDWLEQDRAKETHLESMGARHLALALDPQNVDIGLDTRLVPHWRAYGIDGERGQLLTPTDETTDISHNAYAVWTVADGRPISAIVEQLARDTQLSTDDAKRVTLNAVGELALRGAVSLEEPSRWFNYE